MDVLWRITRQFKTDCSLLRTTAPNSIGHTDTCDIRCSCLKWAYKSEWRFENSANYDGGYPTVGAPARCPWYAWITSRMSPCSTT